MNFDQIIPIIYMIGVLILVLPSFLHSNSKLKQFLANLSISAIVVLIVNTISYFLFISFDNNKKIFGFSCYIYPNGVIENRTHVYTHKFNDHVFKKFNPQ